MMVSLKLLLVFAVVTAIVAGHSGHHHRRVVRRNRCRSGSEHAIKNGYSTTCGFLFRGLQRHCKIHKSALDSLITAKVPSNFDDSMDFLVKLGVGSGGAIDVFIPGLGDLISRLIAALTRIIVCLNGGLGHRDFCGIDYKTYYGVSVLKVTSIDQLINKYNCHNARQQIDDYIEKYSHGKGNNYFTGSRKIIIDTALEISSLLERKNNLCKSDLTTLLQRVFSLTGCLGNSYSKNLGDKFLGYVINHYDNWLEDVGCSRLSSRESSIIDYINGANDDDSSPWANLPDDDDDNDNNNDDDNENNDDNENDDDTTQSDSNDSNTEVSSGNGFSSLISNLQLIFKPIRGGRGKCRISHKVLDYLSNARAPTSFDDVAELNTNLGIVVGGFVDTLIPGLGDLIGRIGIALPKIFLCVLQSDHDSYCSKPFGKVYGITGVAHDINGYIKLYKCQNARKRMLKLLHKHTKGRGIKSIKMGAQRHVLQSCYHLAKMIDMGSSLTKEYFSKFYLEVSTILGLVANSFQSGLGDQITQSMSSSCNKYLSNQGYSDLSQNESDISKTIDTAKNDQTFRQTLTKNTTVIITVTTTTTTEYDETASTTVESNQSSDNQSSQSAQSDQNSQSGQSDQSSQESQNNQSSQTSQSHKSSQTIESHKTSQTTQTSRSVQTSQTAESTQTAQSGQSSQTNDSEESD